MKKLRTTYLPRNFSETGDYTDNELEKTRAYTVLAHAEMEFYFEQIALEIAQKAFKKWEDFHRSSRPLVAMVAYYSGQYLAPPDIHDGNRASENIDEKIKIAYSSYNKKIRASNNGIKEENILSIFLPIGIVIEDIDETLLISLSNFGSKRGTIAHSTKASPLTTPDNAYHDVSVLVSLIDTFDQFLHQYKNQI